MERNAWCVAKDMTERIQGEPGPAGDFMQSFVTPQKEDQFFSILNSSSSLYQQQNLNKTTYQAMRTLRKSMPSLNSTFTSENYT